MAAKKPPSSGSRRMYGQLDRSDGAPVKLSVHANIAAAHKIFAERGINRSCAYRELNCLPGLSSCSENLRIVNVPMPKDPHPTCHSPAPFAKIYPGDAHVRFHRTAASPGYFAGSSLVKRGVSLPPPPPAHLPKQTYSRNPAKTISAARTVSSMTASSCAVEMNPASNCDGAI